MLARLMRTVQGEKRRTRDPLGSVEKPEGLPPIPAREALFGRGDRRRRASRTEANRQT